jgi:hypothetical protein
LLGVQLIIQWIANVVLQVLHVLYIESAVAVRVAEHESFTIAVGQSAASMMLAVMQTRHRCEHTTSTAAIHDELIRSRKNQRIFGRRGVVLDLYDFSRDNSCSSRNCGELNSRHCQKSLAPAPR